ncbi:hypothetical protein FJZ53_01640 [Candidatus Woesearchaeota archaeon]|nr:hypothetical protein [Candidatus Woesearchaeota archaeon]
MARKVEDVEGIMKRYGSKLSREVGAPSQVVPTNEAFSREYGIFRKEALGTAVSVYEKMAKWANGIIKVAVKPQDREEVQAAIETAHSDVTPEEAASLSAIVTIVFVFLSIFIGILSFVLTGGLSMSIVFLSLIILLAGFILSKPVAKFPLQIASRWRLRAGNQMVLCVLYMVMYMRHTSNLEHAIKFAGDHIGNPLALDLRKVYWDVETGKYSTIKESLDHYLEKWRKWNIEFLESIHLIESSLFEPSEERRVERLEKALQVMIEGTYERMLHFAHDVKTPITTLHMLGIILPILGLIILPLMGSFLGIKWWHLAIMYNIILPVMVYQMGTKILEKRPMGYGERNILEEEPQFQKFTTAEFMGSEMDPKYPAITVAFIICLIGLTPLIIHLIDPVWDFKITEDFGSFLDYRESDTGFTCQTGIGCLGPFGLGAAILSLLFILGLAVGIGLYYKLKTRKLIIIRERTKELEKEFAGSLFQLGNRIGDGLPAELAFGNVAEGMKGTPTGDFLSIANRNIRQLGMSVKDAIFDSERGAIISFPSPLIESSMKVLVESSRKGPKVVAQSLISISVYVEKIHQVNERLNDLLSDVTSSMKGQVSFLTPMIAGVVVGIGSMITTIIGKLGVKIAGVASEGGSEASASSVAPSFQNLVQIFPTTKLMPPYFFQIVVGFYVLEIIFILTILSNAIENGMDKISEKHQMGKYFFTSPMFYFVIAFMVMIIFSFLIGKISNF